MAISQANIEWISKLGGVPVEEISGAISDEKEVSLDLKLSGRVIGQDEEKRLREDGVKQGKELGYKEIAQNLEIELGQGEKDPKIIADKLKTSLSSVFEKKYKDATPDEKLKEFEENAKQWEGKYNKLLDTHKKTFDEIKEWEQKFTGLQTDIKQKEINNSVLKHLPKGIKYEPEDALYLTHKYIDFKETETGINVIDKETNTVITNSLGEPETLENSLKLLADKKNWYTRKPGMNGNNQNGKHGLTGGKTKEEAFKIIKESGENPSSPKGLKMFKELTTPVAQ